jgi:uncharacterized protein (TIGR04141 family)
MIDDSQRQSISLSARLLRKGATIESALRDGHDLDEHPSDSGRLFTGQTDAEPPTWLPFLSSMATGVLPALVNQSCSAVLFVTIPDGKQERVAAVTFGSAHHSLDPDAFERNFGLRVVLNSVARSNLRSIDIATLDATTFQKRIQASRDADLRGFGIDVDRDLLRLAAGSPRDASFARSLAGKDALTLHSRLAPSELKSKIASAITLYQASDYKRDFGFIDYVAPVKNGDDLAELDALAFEELRRLVNGEKSDLHIALPDIIGSDATAEIGYFGIGLRSGQKKSFTELSIDDYVSELKAGDLGDITGMPSLRASHEIRIIADGRGDAKQKRKIYDCLIMEAELDGGVYVMFGGEWFAIEKAFHRRVERSFQSLVATPFVASTKSKNERAFIAELNGTGTLLNLDQVKLNPLGASNASLEPCDFLSTSKQFIHLKDGEDSAPISHLWNQGVVSAESFVRDEKFRIDLRKAVQARQRKHKRVGFDSLIPDGRSKPVPADYTVVFGIMRRRYVRTGTLSLPFFSKVSVMSVASRIQLMGFAVEVHLIEKLK